MASVVGGGPDWNRFGLSPGDPRRGKGGEEGGDEGKEKGNEGGDEGKNERKDEKQNGGYEGEKGREKRPEKRLVTTHASVGQDSLSCPTDINLEIITLPLPVPRFLQVPLINLHACVSLRSSTPFRVKENF